MNALQQTLDGVVGIRAVDWDFNLHTDNRHFGMSCDEEGGGLIIEFGLGEDPLSFDTDEALLKTWAALCTLFGQQWDDEVQGLMDIVGVSGEGSAVGIVQIAKDRAGL